MEIYLKKIIKTFDNPNITGILIGIVLSDTDKRFLTRSGIRMESSLDQKSYFFSRLTLRNNLNIVGLKINRRKK